MYRLMALLLLAGCVAKAPTSVTGFRDPSKQIYSNAVLENAKLVGQWRQVAEFAVADAPPCRLGGAEITPASNGLDVKANLCLNGVSTPFNGALRPSGPGRFTAPDGEPWWVIWADVGYRTLVVGTPSGRFGFILNRDADLPEDRLRAAREVLEWNGYTLARMR